MAKDVVGNTVVGLAAGNAVGVKVVGDVVGASLGRLAVDKSVGVKVVGDTVGRPGSSRVSSPEKLRSCIVSADKELGDGD